MGAKDIVTKDYTEDCEIFADAFNQLIYEGEQVIKPGKLKPLNPTMIGVPYGADEAGIPTQKFRDGLKYLTAMEDDSAVYLLMGLENQSEVHYAMPVKDPKILSFVSDYKINLIAPASMTDEELNRFTTSLREVMLFIKYSKDKDRLNKMLQSDQRFRTVDRKAATVISTVTGSKFEVEEEEEEVDMCQAIQEMMEDAKMDGRTAVARKMLEEGGVSMQYIARMTSLFIEEVQALAEASK